MANTVQYSIAANCRKKTFVVQLLCHGYWIAHPQVALTRSNTPSVWCSKFRRDVRVSEVASRLEDLLLEKEHPIGVGMQAMEILLDPGELRNPDDADHRFR